MEAKLPGPGLVHRSVFRVCFLGELEGEWMVFPDHRLKGEEERWAKPTRTGVTTLRAVGAWLQGPPVGGVRWEPDSSHRNPGSGSGCLSPVVIDRVPEPDRRGVPEPRSCVE